MRRLTTRELLEVAAELGARATVDVTGLTAIQETDGAVVDAMASLLVAVVKGRPFDRRNNAVGIVAADLLARLNGRNVDLEPPEEVLALIARIRSGLSASEAGAWLFGRVTVRPPVVGPRCPGCSMPLREALAVQTADQLVVPSCAGCGRVLARPFRHRPLQEV